MWVESLGADLRAWTCSAENCRHLEMRSRWSCCMGWKGRQGDWGRIQRSAWGQPGSKVFVLKQGIPFASKLPRHGGSGVRLPTFPLCSILYRLRILFSAIHRQLGLPVFFWFKRRGQQCLLRSAAMSHRILPLALQTFPRCLGGLHP